MIEAPYNDVYTYSERIALFASNAFDNRDEIERELLSIIKTLGESFIFLPVGNTAFTQIVGEFCSGRELPCYTFIIGREGYDTEPSLLLERKRNTDVVKSCTSAFYYSNGSIDESYITSLCFNDYSKPYTVKSI